MKRTNQTILLSKKNVVFSLFMLFLLTSCAKSNPEKELISNCLKSFNYEYDKILSKSIVASHLDIDEPSYKVEVNNRNEKYGYVNYKWKSDRPDLKTDILGTVISSPDYNIVKLTLLSFLSKDDLDLYQQKSYLDLFKMGYKVISDEEYAVLYANIEKEFAGKPVEMEEAKALLAIRQKSAYKPVNGVGESAFWIWNDVYGLKISVLSGATTFTIELKTSSEPEKSLKDAISIANDILKKCE